MDSTFWVGEAVTVHYTAPAITHPGRLSKQASGHVQRVNDAGLVIAEDGDDSQVFFPWSSITFIRR